MLAWLVACGISSPAPGPSPTAEVPAPVAPAATAVEIYDVPPPPGHRTLQLNGVDPARFELGAIVEIRATDGSVLGTGDIVTNAADPPSITVYVPEARADAMLDARGVRVE